MFLLGKSSCCLLVALLASSSAFAAPRTGVVRLEGTSFADEQGSFPALGASLFWAVWGFKHDRARLEDNLRVLAEHDFDFIRAFAQVGPQYWEDRTIDPGWENYDEVLAGAIDLAYGTYGLRTELTIFGGTDLTPDPESRRVFVERVIKIVEPRAHKVIFVEIANESFHDFIFGAEKIPELRTLAQQVTAGLPNLVAITTPAPGEDGCSLYRDAGVPLGTIHLPRDTRGPSGMWGPVFEPVKYPYACMPAAGVNNEPIGPGASVASEEDAARLVAAAIVTYLAGMPAYVYHSHGGIWGGGERSRGAANLMDHPTAPEIFRGYRRMKEILPADIVSWRREQEGPVRLTAGPHLVVRSGSRFSFMAVGALQVEASAAGSLRLYRLPALDLVREEALVPGAAVELNDEADAAWFGLVELMQN